MLQPTHCNYHIYCIGIQSWLNVKYGTFLMKIVSWKTSTSPYSVCIVSDIIKHAIIVIKVEIVSSESNKDVVMEIQRFTTNLILTSV